MTAGQVRIGVDISTLRPPFTGIANYEFQLLSRLLGLMPEATFLGYGVYRWQAVDAAFFVSRTTTEIPLARRKASPLRYSTLAHSLRNQLRRTLFAATSGAQKLDLYHAFSYRPPAALAVPVVPVVYDLSTMRHPETHPPARLTWLRPLERLCREAAVVHTISQFTASEIETLLGVPRERIVVAPPGVNPLFLDQAPPEPKVLAKLGLSPGAYALTVSTLEPRKNLKTLIEAFAALPAPVRAAMPLVVVGARGWGDIALPRALAALEAEGSIRFTGYVNDNELRSLYAGAKAMLYPSLYEGFGMPITEALACGTPVIASNTASMPEAGGPHSRYVSPLDMESWSRELELAFHSETHLDPTARQARHRHAAGFSWDSAAEVIAAMYRRILR